ncbi:MAG: hypothetical protein H7239_03730 [Flavobacterium sp.]|nr:hypothetical protein [Flavobacterium sp.]
MINKIIIGLALFFSLISFAQEGTSSPYSFYGIGDVRFKGTTENQSMGGLSVLNDSIHLNMQNPASYASLKLTSFAIAGTFSATKLHTYSQDDKAQRTTLNYLAIAIPVKKFGFGFGLIPYSSVGYKIQNTTSDGIYQNIYRGKGGINKVYVGFGYKITKKLNLGADIQYNFGQIKTTSISLNKYSQFGSREVNTSDASGVNLNIGLTHQTKITKKLSLFSSLTFAPQANLNLSNKRVISTVQYNGGIENTIENTKDLDVPKTKLSLPSKFTFGIGVGELKKWSIGTEVTFQNNSGFANRFNDITNVTYTNATKISIGGFYIPKANSFSGYFKRVVYRGGFRYENTGLVINNQTIKDQAFTLGLGMPLRGTFSNINIGAEIGQRGTVLGGLIRENYANISIGLSLNDLWFQKRKYD